jgi:alpha-glucosidase
MGHAGFSTAEPWLPVDGTSNASNVATQRRHKGSMYQLYRRLIELRRERPALSLGDYGRVVADGNLLIFTRELHREHILVALNFGGQATALSLASGELDGRLLLSSARDREEESIRGSVKLRPHEGVVVEVRPAHRRATSSGTTQSAQSPVKAEAVPGAWRGQQGCRTDRA